MSKLNISMPQELLEQIDAEADVLGITRSGLIQEASVRYMAQSRTDREAEARRLRGQAAARRMKAIGAEIGLTSSDTVSLLAEARVAEESRRDR
jgi:metal-responsive CopG/Arc/MetJ family transcriptional regulator